MIPRHTVRAVCDLLGLDPENTAAIALNGIDATITTIDWNGGALTETTHRIDDKTARPYPWVMNPYGYIGSRNAHHIHRCETESPLFVETSKAHNVALLAANPETGRLEARAIPE